ncbi:MAG: carboxypeptidase regulatory-like domain-containing protein [Terriglobales bacterium]
MYAPKLYSQANITGSISGVVTDPSGSAIPNATIVAVNPATGSAQVSKTDAHGNFHFALLPPATYTVTVTVTGFAKAQRSVLVELSQTSSVPFKLGLAGSTQTVEVNGAAPPLLQTENGNVASTIGEKQVKELPIPGGDIYDLAQLQPGAVNEGGTFPSVYGLPTNTNMYTMDGMEDIDPFNNGTNGGATNLLLGINEVQEVTTVSNGYGAKYGTLAGSNVTMVTKSGTNNFHGNLGFYWTGETMMANNFFNNGNGTPRPTSMAKQWVGSIGGPILHNKLFFFVDDEGLAVVLPSSALTLVPSAAFQTATVANITKNHPNSLPFYQNMFKLYDGAAGYSRATAVTQNGGCSAGFSIPGASAAPCALQFYSNASNFAWENILTTKEDWNAGPSDHVFFHWLLDRGVQSSGIDPINPTFNQISNQPEFQSQINWSHTFGSSGVNSLLLAAQHYNAVFGPPDLAAALQLFPGELDFGDGSFTSLGGSDAGANAGRAVTRIQISDDFVKTIGSHSFDFGFTGSKYLANTLVSSNINGDWAATDQDAFYNGGLDTTSGSNTQYTHSYPLFGMAPLRMMRYGVYVDDNWRFSPKLTVTLGLRLDHPTSPSCAQNCFSSPGDFLSMSHDATQPYNAVLQTGLANAIGNVGAIEWQPRIGFAWQPWGGTTVIRGGFGMFANNFPIDVANGFLANLPEDPAFAPTSGLISPAEGNSALSVQAQSAENALKSGFANGATLATLEAAVPGFAPPTLTTAASPLVNPTYYKWSLQVQHEVWQNAALTVGYEGNHGDNEMEENPALNAYSASGYGGDLPTTDPDAMFGQVLEYQSNGYSNYDGLTGTFRDNFSSGVLMLNYSWGHSLGTASTLEYPNDPGAVYGNASTNVANSFSGNYAWNVPFQQWFGGSKAISGGWQITGTFQVRSGLPYSVFDSHTLSTLKKTNYESVRGGGVLANFDGTTQPSCSGPDTTCLVAADFSRATSGFGNQSVYSFTGPGFWDTDMNVKKSFAVPGWESAQLQLTGSAYNLFNHPNFGNPNTTLGSSHFGQITSTTQNASSILGDNGGDASPRLIELEIGLNW